MIEHLGKEYKGALFGAGGVARLAHLPAYGVNADCRLSIIAAVDDADIEPLDGIKHLKRKEDLAPLASRLDFVDVCTPTSSHLELVTWALAQGYHVMCEKPVALSLGEAEQIRAAAHRAGRVVMACHQYRYNPAWQKVRAWLDEGAIGRWHLAEVHVGRPHADQGALAQGTPWRGLRAQSRGGVLLDHGTHWLYLLMDVAGAPTRVQSWTGRLRHSDYDVEDTAHLLLEFKGRLATMLVTWAATKRENRVRFVGEKGTIEWSGTRLSLDAEAAGGRRESLDFTAALDKKAYKEWFAALFARFTEAMDHGTDEAALEEIAQVASILEHAYRAPIEVVPGVATVR
ncbi:MAG: Gfo/Idh/MocA family protein [Gemmatimonadales bacterium]